MRMNHSDSKIKWHDPTDTVDSKQKRNKSRLWLRKPARDREDKNMPEALEKGTYMNDMAHLCNKSPSTTFFLATGLSGLNGRCVLFVMERR